MAQSKKPQKSAKRNVFESIRIKLTLIIIAIMAVPLLTAVSISYLSSHSEAVKNMESMNVAQAALVEHDFSAVVEQNRNVIMTIASSVSVRNVLKGEEDTATVIEWLAQSDATVGDGNTTVITGPDGMQVARPKGDLVDVSDREYFKVCKADKKFYVSDQNISKTSGKRICTFITPVLDADGTFLGAVQRNYDLVILTDLCKSEMTGSKQDIFIGDNNGDLIAHTSIDLETGEPVNFSSQQWFTESRSNSEASGSYNSSFNGGKWKMSYQREPVTGWVTVIATDEGEALSSANRTLTIIILVGLIMLIIAAVIAILMANGFVTPIYAVNASLDKLANGEFLRITDARFKGRKDEFGEMIDETNSVIDRLDQIVSNIKESASAVDASSQELAETTNQISQTADDVSNAVQEIATGATQQAEEIQHATENTGRISDNILDVSTNATDLGTTAQNMNGNSQDSVAMLERLRVSSEQMKNAIDDISEKIGATSRAVENINDKVTAINEIASQTNLLSLNASIEAARAGEAGKGFAVVAEEIGKLADNSAVSANEIRSEMDVLLAESQAAVDQAAAVRKTTDEQSEILSTTMEAVNKLIADIRTTVDGVQSINSAAEICSDSKTVVVDSMSSLSAISEENAAASQETSASMQELNATVNTLAASANQLKDIANKLNDEMAFFK
ncbi:MAG: methyl-accepting chemotaxis protein [Lachnospiraceae bacterium]|nr:methyl-accepting chemotaxis protein [Lachnospiraceae bacterium]